MMSTRVLIIIILVYRRYFMLLCWVHRKKIVTIHSPKTVNSNGFVHANRLRRWDESLLILRFMAVIAQ